MAPYVGSSMTAPPRLEGAMIGFCTMTSTRLIMMMRVTAFIAPEISPVARRPGAAHSLGRLGRLERGRPSHPPRGTRPRHDRDRRRVHHTGNTSAAPAREHRGVRL